MIDVNRLRGVIAERGMSQRKVAAQLGITEKTFYTKMKIGVFGTDEVEKMVEILNIKEPEKIFLVRR